jgi:hypothetical protein
VTSRRAEIATFLTDALTSALEQDVMSADDALRFLTPDVLAASMPRPLWARLITACLGAVRVDSALVVETVGIPNLCEHAPHSVVWACLADAAARELGDSSLALPVPAELAAPLGVEPTLDPALIEPVTSPPSLPLPLDAQRASHLAGLTTPPSGTRVPVTAGGPGEWMRAGAMPQPLAITPPPAPREPEPEMRTAVQAPPTPIPAPSPVASPPTLDMLDDLDDPIAPPPAPSAGARMRGGPRQPMRPPSTNAARATAHTTRRPQAQAATPPATTPPRRDKTELSDYDIATDIRSADEFRTPGGDDLVEWTSDGDPVGGNDELGRKR